MHVKALKSLAPPHREILLVRARAYQVTVQFPKKVVRSDRRARAAARCMVDLAVIIIAHHRVFLDHHLFSPYEFSDRTPTSEFSQGYSIPQWVRSYRDIARESSRGMCHVSPLENLPVFQTLNSTHHWSATAVALSARGPTMGVGRVSRGFLDAHRPPPSTPDVPGPPA
jgi:hypothetical protein